MTTLNNEGRAKLEAIRSNCKFLRKIHHFSLEQLSEFTGIDKNVLLDIEEGEEFNIKNLIKLCKFYKIDFSDIFSPLYPITTETLR